MYIDVISMYFVFFHRLLAGIQQLIHLTYPDARQPTLGRRLGRRAEFHGESLDDFKPKLQYTWKT